MPHGWPADLLLHCHRCLCVCVCALTCTNPRLKTRRTDATKLATVSISSILSLFLVSRVTPRMHMWSRNIWWHIVGGLGEVWCGHPTGIDMLHQLHNFPCILGKNFSPHPNRVVYRNVGRAIKRRQPGCLHGGITLIEHCYSPTSLRRRRSPLSHLYRYGNW